MMLPSGDRQREEPTCLQPLRAAPMGLVLGLSLSVAACGSESSDRAAGAADDGPPTAEEIRAASAPTGPSTASASSSDASEPAPGASSGAAPTPDDAPASGHARPSDGPIPVEAGGPPYAVQLGAFRREANARALQESLEAADFPVWTATTEAMDGPGGEGAAAPALLRVRVGATPTVADARRLVDLIRGRLPGVVDSAWIAPLATDGGTTDEMMQTTAALLEDG